MTTRIATETPARIERIAALPLFHKLHGRRAVVAGGSSGALWKAELLSAAGADVLVLALHDAGARLFEGLARDPVDGTVTVLARRWQPEDLDGAAVAIGDIADDVEAVAFIAAAHDAGAPVNMIDRTHLCDVQFGTIVNRAPVTIAINTDGGAPMLGQSIRTRIEAVLPRSLGAWAAAAKSWRPRVKQAFGSFAERRAFWTRFTAHAWGHIDRVPEARDFDALVGVGAAPQGQGSVTLVGAGPGDPELLTMKAVRALQSATVILYDDLVTPDVLEMARREATRIAVGKKGHGPSVKQSEINARIVELARAGETVVRLKGGDPLIFGRATEELDACRAAGVPVTIIPGISAAQGAAAALGISLTERETARRVQFVTGHGTDGGLPADINWSAIADPKATTIIYMPIKTLKSFTELALRHGLDPATPAVLAASATRPEQILEPVCIDALPAAAERLPAGVPALVIIGEVTRDRAALQRLAEAA